MEPLTKTNKESSAALGAFDRLFNVCQFLGLSAIAIAAIVGFGAELWRMVTADTIALGDLLLLFLYTEVMVMARAALHSHHELAIAMPIGHCHRGDGALYGCEFGSQRATPDDVRRRDLHSGGCALSLEDARAPHRLVGRQGQRRLRNTHISPLKTRTSFRAGARF